ncbi:MAG TPA: transferrin receptor-like dimerization domain-containing protein, partial [Planctomycetota bacterium]|nr:transferrin receptor-like dimerization domain-containing protein [Planctomycetota bacterium]
TFVPPKSQAPVPPLDFGALRKAVDRLSRSAKEHDAARPGASGLSLEAKKALDAVLLKSERALTRDEGLPRRPWFKHAIYAPGFYTGYGVKTLPGIREAIEERKWDEAAAQIEGTARVIDRYASEIERATPLLR